MGDNTKDDVAELRFTAQLAVDLIYNTLDCLHRVLVQNKIAYTIFGGTALGAERHGGLIPWDDDADTVILSNDEQRLLALTDRFAEQGYTLIREPSFGYRLYHTTLATPRPLDQFPFPFVDIFLMKDTGSAYEYITEEARTLWPQTPLPYGCFNRLVDVQFGHLTVRSLNSKDVQQHLDDNYGKDWSSVAWREYDHFYYENVTNAHVNLREDKTRRPARHSKHQRTQLPFKSVLNQHSWHHRYRQRLFAFSILFHWLIFVWKYNLMTRIGTALLWN